MVDGSAVAGELIESKRPSKLLGTPQWNPRRIKRDYVYRDVMNRRLGMQGEPAVVELERRRLSSLGRRDLADLVEHFSRRAGDGFGL